LTGCHSLFSTSTLSDRIVSVNIIRAVKCITSGWFCQFNIRKKEFRIQESEVRIQEN
jgi:hypothetical protein